MPYVCDRCSLLCSDLNALKVHMRKHTNEKPYSCPICNRQFAQKGNLKTHMSNVHDNQKQFICDKCRKQFTQKKSLGKHQLKCGKSDVENFLKEENGFGGIKSVAVPQITSGLGLTLDYPTILESFKLGALTNIGLMDDSQFHQNGAEFCLSSVIQSTSDSRNNSEKQNDKQPFMCDRCNMVFKSKTKLILHISFHDGLTPMPFVCHVCNKGFTHKGSMNAHIRFIHKGERPFSCSLCPKSFSNKCHLKLHMRIHTKEKPYECDICNKTFARSEHHRYHLKTHRTDNIFGCTSCDASFRSAALLRKHNKQHRDKPRGQITASPKYNTPAEDMSTPSENSLVAGDSLSVHSVSKPESTVANPDGNGMIMDKRGWLEDPDLKFGQELGINNQGVRGSSFNQVNAVYPDSAQRNAADCALSILTLLNSQNAFMDLSTALDLPKLYEFSQPYSAYNHILESSPTSSQQTLFSNPALTADASSCMVILTPANSSASTNSVLSCTNVDEIIQQPVQSIFSDICAENLETVNETSKRLPSLSSVMESIPSTNIDSIPENSLTTNGSASPNISTSNPMLHSGRKSSHLYRCDECDKRFASSHHLLNHERVHSGERPFQCELCPSQFTQASSLKFHVSSVHEGERKHRCTMCSSMFARLSHLKRHVITHLQEKPYKCSVCGRSFTEKGKLRIHLATHNLDEVTINELLPSFMRLSNLSSARISGSDESPCATDGNISIYIQSHGCSVEVLPKHLNTNTQTLNGAANLRQNLESVGFHNSSGVVGCVSKGNSKQGAKEKQGDLQNDTEGSSFELSSCKITTRSKTQRCKQDATGNLVKNVTKADCSNEAFHLGNKKCSKRSKKDKFGKCSEPSLKSSLKMEDGSYDDLDKRINEKKRDDSHVNDSKHVANKATKHLQRQINGAKNACLQCDQCGKSFKSLSILRSHHVVHSGLKPYKCDVCDKSFTQRSSLRVHVDVIHNNYVKLQCSQCPKTFSHKSHLKRHIDIHLGRKRFSCDICGQKFHENSRMLLHRKVHEKKENANKDSNCQNNDNLTCEICSKSFLKQNYLSRHMILHSQVSTYQCDQCSKQYRQKSSLEAHMRLHTGERPFSCESCNKTFSRLSSLTAHKEIHLKDHERNYECSTCLLKFGKISSLIVHLRRAHHGLGLDQAIRKRSELKAQHRLALLARDSRPWSCGFCPKRFPHKSMLEKHVRVHSRDKPFSCPNCEQSFTQKGSLMSHMRFIHIGDLPFNCSLCDKKFSNNRQLLSHNKKIHPDHCPSEQTTISSIDLNVLNEKPEPLPALSSVDASSGVETRFMAMPDSHLWSTSLSYNPFQLATPSPLNINISTISSELHTSYDYTNYYAYTKSKTH